MLSSHYAEVGGARVHYVREGTGPHPVLLLPGALGSAVSDFTPQLEGLSKVYRAYNTLMGPKKVLLKIRKKSIVVGNNDAASIGQIKKS